MAANLVFTQDLAELMRDPFGHPSSVHKNQRAAVRVDQLDNPLVDLAPLLRRAHG